MTEHIVQFGVGIDDAAIIRSVEESAKNQIINDIKADVLNRIFKSSGYYGTSSAVKTTKNGVEVDRDAILSSFAKEVIISAFESHKDEIIERTTKVLADKIARSKAFKEKVGEVMK